MNVKRIISGIVGFPLVVVLMLLGNFSIYIIDVAITALAAISMYEFLHCFKSTNKANPISWVCYLSCVLILVLHIVPNEYLIYIVAIMIPLFIAILFIHVIVSNLKTTIVDIAVSLFGIFYVTMFYAFIPLIYGLENGNYFVWFAIFAAWGTDIMAYAVGRRIGKHKFSKVSPNKSIEGCIAGTLGAIIIVILYAVWLNKCCGFNINLIFIGATAFLLSLVGQIGDFAASSIKRYAGVKDFSNLIPGHGGILDRCDSLMFIAPFAFFLLMLI